MPNDHFSVTYIGSDQGLPSIHSGAAFARLGHPIFFRVVNPLVSGEMTVSLIIHEGTNKDGESFILRYGEKSSIEMNMYLANENVGGLRAHINLLNVESHQLGFICRADRSAGTESVVVFYEFVSNGGLIEDVR